jgi:hypothetical protein
MADAAPDTADAAFDVAPAAAAADVAAPRDTAVAAEAAVAADVAVVSKPDAGVSVDALSPDLKPAADAPVAVAEALGFYSGDWGAMVLRMVGSEVHGTYSHDQGTIVGTFREGVLYAWWAEVPSREPTNDAGECEFRFIRKSTGRVAIDGRWRYGTQGDWREDWDIDQVDGMPPAELVARFMDASAFRKHP